MIFSAVSLFLLRPEFFSRSFPLTLSVYSLYTLPAFFYVWPQLLVLCPLPTPSYPDSLSINIVILFPFFPLIVAVLLLSPLSESTVRWRSATRLVSLFLWTSRLPRGCPVCLAYGVQRVLSSSFDLHDYDLHDIFITSGYLVMSCQELVLSFWLALSTR